MILRHALTMMALRLTQDHVTEIPYRLRLFYAIFILPLLSLLLTLVFALASLIFFLRSEVYEGTVVHLQVWQGVAIFRDDPTTYEPVFTYIMDGEQRRATTSFAHPSFNIPVGETAMIRAIPGTRREVRLDTWQGLWFIPVTLGWITALGFGVGLVVWWGANRRYSRKDRA